MGGGTYRTKKPAVPIPEEPETTEEEFGIPRGYKLVKEPKTARLQLLITPRTKEELKKRAAEEGRSVNEVCNTAIAEYLGI